MISGLDYLLIGLAGVGGGAVNALAGGGTLITFPALLAAGLPAVAANVTSTVALCPGYFGATLAQRQDLSGQGPRLRWLLPAAALGGLAGGLLLLKTGEGTFRTLVPFLILLASALLALQNAVRALVERHLAGTAGRGAGRTPVRAAVVTGAAAIYGGYFGAGLGVILLAVLGIVLEDTLTRLNALKQALSLAVNTTAAVLFVFSGRTVWPAAIVMAAGAIAGGAIGGRTAGRVRPETLRAIVVTIGLAVGLYYLVR